MTSCCEICTFKSTVAHKYHNMNAICLHSRLSIYKMDFVEELAITQGCRKSSNLPTGGSFIFDTFWVGAYSKGGSIRGGGAYKIT